MHAYSIKTLYDALAHTENLAPNPRTNQLFSYLVSFVLSEHPHEITLTDEQIAHLHTICSKGEYALERFWSHEISMSNAPHQKLRQFPYLQNYRKLTALEWSSLITCTAHTDHTILFCGGGPLPMTSIILALEYHISSVVIDYDMEAVAYATRAIHTLGLSDLISVQHGDASTFNAYANFNTIFIAALAGTDDRAKETIFQRIARQMEPDTHIIARSSKGKRTLLYRPLSPITTAAFTTALEVHPTNDIINSVIILKQHG